MRSLYLSAATAAVALLIVGGCHARRQTAAPVAPVKLASATSTATMTRAKTPAAAPPAVHHPANYKPIAVTIDDGPSLQYVLKAVQEARKVGGHITFFVTGRWLSKEPQIARIITQYGDQIGNHTWHHLALAKLPPDKVREEMKSLNDLIVKSGGAKPTFFRPPYGSHNATVDKIGAELGMKCAMWDIDPQDWRGGPGSKTVSIILGQARPGKIVLIHEVHNTYLSLGAIFQGLTKKGFTLVRLDQLPKETKHR
jgi:peptidoglycan/xylan/chitin deacetylase (PgdA/CDA1 family)